MSKAAWSHQATKNSRDVAAQHETFDVQKHEVVSASNPDRRVSLPLSSKSVAGDQLVETNSLVDHVVSSSPFPKLCSVAGMPIPVFELEHRRELRV